MARIPRDVVDAVRDRTDIVEVVSRHVKLVRRGGNHVGLCPFHQEKSPSFNVNPSKGIFHCFGCNVGGDVFKFLMMIEGLSFMEAVKELAGPAGVAIQERELDPAERRRLRQRSTLYDVLESACAFYESVLWTLPEGEPGRRYLERRGISREHARAARMGFAPDAWSRLLDHLDRQGFSGERLEEAGLARRRNSGTGFYDTLRNRLLFPIRDERSRVIAFGGRLLEGDGPKYLNTPESPVYEKSKVLYGLDVARRGIQQRDRALVVEGYFDVLSLHQAGFTEAVATCGTALTREHLEKIRRLSSDVVLVLDADEAGQRAAERSLPLFLEVGLHPWRLVVPDAKDPDDLVREGGPEAMEAALETREPLIEWLVRRKLEAFGRRTAAGVVVDAMTQERVIDELGPLLAQLADPLVSRVAALLRVHEERLRERLAQQVRRPAPDEAPPPAPEAAGWRPHRDVVHLLWLLVHRYDVVADLVVRSDPRLLDAHDVVRPIVARLAGGEPVASVLDDTTDPGLRRTLSAIVARDRLYTRDEAPLAVCQVLDRLGKPLREARKAALNAAAGAASEAGDLEALRSAASEKADIARWESALQRSLRSRDLEACAQLLSRAIGLDSSTNIT